MRELHTCRHKKGFTLIELAVVMAVLLVLAAIMIPMLLGMQDKARTRVDETNAKILTDIATRYYTDHNHDSYPGADEGWPATTDKFEEIADIDGLSSPVRIQNKNNRFSYDQDTGIVSVVDADDP